MPAAQDTAESAEPPATATRGAEIAPLVEAEPSPAELLRKAHEEIEDAEARLRRWEEGVGATAAARAPFDLTIQPVVSGEDAAIELSGVTAAMPVSELLDLIHAEKLEATPDRQRLFIAEGAQEPLADETLPIGAYGVVEGVALHMAMRDEKAAAARRVLRAKLREELREQRAQLRARDLEERRQREERERREWRERQERQERVEKAKRWAPVLLLAVGAAVQQVGWWSLYSDLGLWCGLLGGAAVLAGALGFDRGTADHSEDWNDRPYTADERRVENERRRAEGMGRTPEEKEGRRWPFWRFLAGYALFGAAATGLSAGACPALGTDDSSAAGYGDCSFAAVFVGLSLPFLIFFLWVVCVELVAMRRASKTPAELEEEARQLQALRQSPVPLRKAKRWLALLFVGLTVQQLGWWSHYGDLGLWCGLLGGAAVLAGALGLDCGVAGHSEHWDWERRPYTAEERREENERRRASCCERELPEWARKGKLWTRFWMFLSFYAVVAFFATGVSAANCPALGTGDSSTAGGDGGWGERYDHCGHVALLAGVSLPCLLLPLLLWPVRKELAAMGRAAQRAPQNHPEPFGP
eukprot:COSAG04_NODE_1233_length_7642_cov_5.063900_5_plen_585_part_00